MEMRILTILLTMVLLQFASSLDTYHEQLDIFQLPQGYYLNNFTFSFTYRTQNDKRTMQQVDYFPLHILNFIEANPEFKELQLDLVQGRWQENVIKRVTQYSNQQFELDNFEYKEPGLNFKYYLGADGGKGSLNQELNEKLFALLSSLFSLDIIEQKAQYLTLSDYLNRQFYFYSKPYEPSCKENLSFLLKYIKLLAFESGFRPLINEAALHQSMYKHFRFNLEKSSKLKNNGEVEEEVVVASFSIAYLTQKDEKKLDNLESILQATADKTLIKCLVCSSSIINFYHSDNKVKVIYDSKVNSGEPIPLKVLRADKTQQKDVELKAVKLQSERYLSDLHFYKEGTFFHKMVNTDKHNKATVVVQEFFPSYIRPYLHQLKVQRKEFESDLIIDEPLEKDQIEIHYDKDSNCLLRIRDLIVQPQSEIVISFGIRKHMNMFEEYPNDPHRGFNIASMPVYVKFDSDNIWNEKLSQALLVKIIEPDFSMPFNVNAVTNALIGFLFINTYNTIVKPKRFV